MSAGICLTLLFSRDLARNPCQVPIPPHLSSPGTSWDDSGCSGTRQILRSSCVAKNLRNIQKREASLFFSLNGNPKETSDERDLIPDVTFVHPLHSPLPYHVHGFISLKRSAGSLEGEAARTGGCKALRKKPLAASASRVGFKRISIVFPSESTQKWVFRGLFRWKYGSCNGKSIQGNGKPTACNGKAHLV